jgi:hypothetical protein
MRPLALVRDDNCERDAEVLLRKGPSLFLRCVKRADEFELLLPCYLTPDDSSRRGGHDLGPTSDLQHGGGPVGKALRRRGEAGHAVCMEGEREFMRFATGHPASERPHERSISLSPRCVAPSAEPTPRERWLLEFYCHTVVQKVAFCNRHLAELLKRIEVHAFQQTVQYQPNPRHRRKRRHSVTRERNSAQHVRAFKIHSLVSRG